MYNLEKKSLSRREFLKDTGKITVASALTAGFIPHVYPGENNTIKVALVGCGGRGAGAASNALSVENGPIKLVALADVFEERIIRTYDSLKKIHPKQIDVPEDHKFIGFDAYKDAMDCLSPGDVVILATPPAFRWVHFTYAIEKGINVFMEKPVTVDGPTTRKFLKLAEDSVKKNLKVGVGLMCRHCEVRGQLYDRIKDGQIGDIITLRAYRLHGPLGYFASDPKPENISELLYQVQRFHSFLWASGGSFSDFYIHHIDECCWMKDAWPVKAQALGGRHYRGISIDQNFDNYSVEYTFADGTKLFLYGRCIDGCHDEFASYAHGTKGSAVISQGGHTPARCRIYKGQDLEKKDDLVWSFPGEEPNPYQLEWDHLIDAIRKDKPFNEAKRGAEASLVTSMGRMAAHTGRIITYEEILSCEHEFAPGLDRLTMNSQAPLQAGPDGKYPVTQPGMNKFEYGL
ncbi:MAG TPA: Gfo/Idh/MocA family oxidoreductase [Cyclobacteriaceae bacterium]|nr:Gfo/Idh/MocA family oxidoreductase [Cyclobacteriaceae bacterium]